MLSEWLRPRKQGTGQLKQCAIMCGGGSWGHTTEVRDRKFRTSVVQTVVGALPPSPAALPPYAPAGMLMDGRYEFTRTVSFDPEVGGGGASGSQCV